MEFKKKTVHNGLQNMKDKNQREIFSETLNRYCPTLDHKNLYLLQRLKIKKYKNSKILRPYRNFENFRSNVWKKLGREVG